jgi:hypothetical protein
MAILLFLLIQKAKGDWAQKIVQLMFAGYGQGVLLFPIIVAASRLGDDRRRLRAIPTVVGLIIGFVILWVISVLGILTNDLVKSQIAILIAIVPVATGVFIAFKRQGRGA